MSKKSQKYTLLQNRPGKFQKITSPSHPKSYFQELEVLSNQVEQSKIAVENITTFGANQQNFRTKLDAIQSQLQICVTNINIETKRNKLLNELITLLKGQMLKYQNTQKKKEEAEELHRDKMMKKIEYEIDQICQKHNEEIAKIHQLKELANSRRSERVVYSNLFKKLEKQIKIYEESYKDQLIKWVALENKQIALAKQKIQDKTDQHFDEEDQVLMNQLESSQILESQFHDSYPKNSWHHYNQNGHPSYLQPEKKRNVDREYSDILRMGREQKTENSAELQKRILNLKNLIEKVKTYAQCESADEILSHYRCIKEQNQRITGSIDDEQAQIERIGSDINAFSKKIAEVKFQRQYAPISEEQEMLPGHINMKEYDYRLLPKISSDDTQYNRHLSQILSVFGISCEASEMKQELMKLSDAFNELSNKETREAPVLFSKLEKNTKIIRQDSNISEAGVKSILDRMDKFSNCQKIFDRKYFQQEYYKEISRKKNSNSGSKLKRYF